MVVDLVHHNFERDLPQSTYVGIVFDEVFGVAVFWSISGAEGASLTILEFSDHVPNK